MSQRAAVRQTLIRRPPDIVHTHGYHADVLCAPVARSLSLTTASTVHGFIGNTPKGRFYEWLDRRTLRKVDAVVAVSRKLSTQLIESGVASNRVHTLKNAWVPAYSLASREESRQRLGIPSDAWVVGWVGRLSTEKGPDIMLKALGAMRDEGARLCFVGSGPMEEELRTLSHTLRLGTRVSWPGVVENAARYMKAFDTICLSSWTEGTPMTLLEAMHAGVPIVTTAVGGVPDVVTTAEAHLCEPGDPSALAAALAEVRSDPSATAARVQSARSRLRRDHDVKAWVTRHRQIYDLAAAHRSE